MYDYRNGLRNSAERDIWVMKEHSVVESQVKLEIFHPNPYSITLFTLLTDGRMLMKLVFDLVTNPISGEDTECKWLLYNDKGEAVREICVDGICKWYGIDEFDYVETLVSAFAS